MQNLIKIQGIVIEKSAILRVFLTLQHLLEGQPEFSRKICSGTFFTHFMFKVYAKFQNNPRRSFWEKCHFGYFEVFLTLQHPLEGQPEFSQKIHSGTLFTHIMFEVCAKFFLNPRRGFWEKCHFGYFGVFLTLQHPLEGQPEFSPKIRSGTFFTHIMFEVCAKFLKNPRHGFWEKCYFSSFWPWNTPRGPTRVFPKNLFCYHVKNIMFEVCAKFQKIPRRSYWEKCCWK